MVECGKYLGKCGCHGGQKRGKKTKRHARAAIVPQWGMETMPEVAGSRFLALNGKDILESKKKNVFF